MNISENFKISFRNLWTGKMRTFLTLLGIIIGVMAIVLLVSVINGSKTQIEDEILAMGSNMLMVFPGNTEASMGPPGSFTVNKLRMRHIDLIEARSSYGADACPEYDLMGVIAKYKNESKTVAFVIGVTENFEKVYTWKVNTGSCFREGDVKTARRVCVVGETVIKNIFKGLNPIGKDLTVRGLKFRVLGIMEPKGKMFGMDMDNSIYMPITTAHNMMGSNEINQITIRIPDAKNIDKAVAETKRTLLMDLEKTDFSVTTQGESLDMFKSVMSALELVTYVIASISLLVGGIGIMNIMLVTVTERTREIGIRKAVGASSHNILVQFLVEAIIVTVMGGLIGILASVGILAAIAPFVPFPLKASLASIIISFTFCCLIGIFFGTYPALKAARTDPIVALGYE
ncbi:MAG: ABC transporter permease [Candidatus Firestonebacteria bacterium]